MILGSFSKDIIDHIADVQFQRAQRYDFHIGFVEPASARRCTRSSICPACCGPNRSPVCWYGCAPLIIRVASVSSGLREIDNCYADRSQLRAATLPRRRRAFQDTRGISATGIGDFVTVETMEGERRTLEVALRTCSTISAGRPLIWIWTRLIAFCAKARPSWARFSPPIRPALPLYAALKITPRVAGITAKRAALASFRQTSRRIFSGCASSTSSSAAPDRGRCVYNSARIALSERSRDLATLRVVGFTLAKFHRFCWGRSLARGRGDSFWVAFRLWFAAFATWRCNRDATFSARRATGHLCVCRHCRSPRRHRLERDRQVAPRPARFGQRVEITRLTTMTKQRLVLFLFAVLLLGCDRLCVSAEAPSGRNRRVRRGPLQVTVDHEGRTRIKERYVVSAPLSGRMLRVDFIRATR